MSIHVDSKDFERKFSRLLDFTIPKRSAQGLEAAALALLEDSVYVEPFAPFHEGKLRGSRRVDDVVVAYTYFSIDCGFNIEYAGKWHELPQEKADKINWTLPGSGPKYMEKKMMMFADKYVRIAADFIKTGT